MMYKYLFFDDRRLCGRKNVIRQYGKPTLVERYSDGVSGCDRAPVCVFKTDDGKYRMLYFGKCKFGYACLFVATSDDGIHFSPENISDKVGYEGRNEPHEILRLSPGDEIGAIIDDPYGKKEERYKMLYCRLEKENVRFVDEVYVSPDLLHWKKLEGVDWNKNGTEPITSAFYNYKRSCYTIISRPLWGTREVGIIETKDFRTFSPYVHALNADSLDGPIEEFYGLPAFEYDGYFIGYPLIYGNLNYTYGYKFDHGTIIPQLAYSYNGIHWQRSLREPFIDGFSTEYTQKTGFEAKLIWPGTTLKNENDDIIIYAAVSNEEHGPKTFSNPEVGEINIFSLRKDGFIKLKSENPNEESAVLTRENIWHGGPLKVNIKAASATVAVYETVGTDENGNDCDLGVVVPGFSHEDCEVLSGDNTDWEPKFKGGSLDRFIGKTIRFEIKFTDGELYSLSGDMTPIMNMEAFQYRKLGITTPKSEL